MDPRELMRSTGSTRAERDDALARTREMIRLQRQGRRDRWPPVVFGSSYVVVSLIALSQLDALSLQQAAAICLLLPLYVIAQRLGLEDDDGSFVLTQSVFVAMLFLVPLALVPMLVLVGALAGAPRDPTAYHPIFKFFHVAMNGWFCVGPVVVLAVADVGAASLQHWPVYVAALLAQFVGDGVIALACTVASGGSLAGFVRPMLWTSGMDTLLAAIGLSAVIATQGSLWAVAFAAAPIAMLVLLTADRRAQVARAVAVTDAFDEAVEQSRVDALTTLANRRKWNEAIEHAEVRRKGEIGLEVTAVMADIDGLKGTNDSFGHQAGDELIRAAAAVIQQAAPADAVVARLGGDEFGMLVVHRAGEVTGAQIVADIQGGVTSREIVAGVRLSMSVGSATCPPATAVLSAVNLADERTLADKRLRKAERAS